MRLLLLAVVIFWLLIMVAFSQQLGKDFSTNQNIHRATHKHWKLLRRVVAYRIPPEVIKNGEELIVLSTAYEGSERSCGKWAHFHKTFTGIIPHKGIAAVDPNFIPLHSRLYVYGYGYADSEDTGSSIKGARIDVFFPTVKECMKWGRRKVRVWILNRGNKDKGRIY